MDLGNWIGGVIRGARDFALRMADETRGNVALIFGLSLPVLILMTVGGVDIHRASTVRVNLQDALDAAALSAARSPYTRDVDLQRVGLAALKANLKAYPNITLREADTSFTLRDDEVVVARSKVDVKAIVANIFLPPYGKFMDDFIPVGADSEVNRATTDLEVSLVLDITGSMAGTRLSDLQEAAGDLVDLVVQDDQTISSTRMALVPYSMGVNAGTYLNAVRGAARGPTSITGAAWMVADTQKTISAISKANPGVFTANSHGYSTDDIVWISGITQGANNTGTTNMTGLNDTAYKVVKINNNTFSLKTLGGSNINTTNNRTYTANSGIARRCLISSCEVVVTSANHGLATGEDVRILNVKGMTQINTDAGISGSNLFETITRQTSSTFSLNGWNPTRATSTYSGSGGSVQCLEYGCASFLFTNNSNALRVYDASNCVSERTGDDAYTDVAPSTSRVAFSYVGTTDVTQGGCMTTTFTPLTTNKVTLHDQIDDYKAEGGTAGQIGVGWGWYMVSPTFGSIFPTASRPEPYGTKGLLKVVIIMTDGEFNAVYYDGVRARDSGTGGGSNDRWINHNSNNGSPFIQSVNMCAAMKAKGIIVYTVGFDISGTRDTTPNTVDTATEVMQRCATSPDHVYLPENGSSLKSAFAAIGRSISQLRISR